MVLGGVDLGKPFTVRGTEPFWAIAVTPRVLTYSGVDRPPQSGPNPGPVLSGGRATYSIITDLHAPMILVLTPGPCSDGMSETVYPLTATVHVGAETLTGCAGA
jgi:uncharacterized membrane protein